MIRNLDLLNKSLTNRSLDLPSLYLKFLFKNGLPFLIQNHYFLKLS